MKIGTSQMWDCIIQSRWANKSPCILMTDLQKGFSKTKIDYKHRELAQWFVTLLEKEGILSAEREYQTGRHGLSQREPGVMTTHWNAMFQEEQKRKRSEASGQEE